MELTKAEDELLDQIYTNMCNRGVIEWEEGNIEREELQKSELYIFAYHLKKLFYEEISDLLLQKSIDFEDLRDIENKYHKPKVTKPHNMMINKPCEVSADSSQP